MTMLSPYECSRYWIPNYLRYNTTKDTTTLLLSITITLLIIRDKIRCIIRCPLSRRISLLLFLSLFLRTESSAEKGSLSSKAASVQFQMDSEGMSLLLPHPSLGTSPLFRGCWQNLSMRHPREYFMWKTLTGRKQDISVSLVSSCLPA